MIERDEPYRDLGPDWLHRRHDEARTRRLVTQLERLGHTVVIRPSRLIPRPTYCPERHLRRVTHALLRLFTGL